MTQDLSIVRACLFGAISFVAFSSAADACTRVLFHGDGNTVITGRTMDWMEDSSAKMWLFPRGMSRDGAAGPESVRWTSNFGSVAVSIYDGATTDGMNEKGLVVNALYLAESDFGKTDGTRPLMSVSVWAQYVLDNFATVSDAVSTLQSETFRLVAPKLPNGMPAVAHLAISDPTGDSAILEYLDGRLSIHQGSEFRVLTNSPDFTSQLAINAYWQSNGGNFLPGSIDSADRFVRASFMLEALPTEPDRNFIGAVPGRSFGNQSVAGVLGVLRSVSVPLGFSCPTKPNVATTLWRTVHDQRNMTMFFDSATAPCCFSVSLKNLDFSPNAPVKSLNLTGGRMLGGDATGQFTNATPFAFLTTNP